MTSVHSKHINVGGLVVLAAAIILVAAWPAAAQTAPGCSCDLNGDSVVDALDLAILLGGFGNAPGSRADFNRDGVIDRGDLAMLLVDWGPCDPFGPEIGGAGGAELATAAAEAVAIFSSRLERGCICDLDTSGAVDGADLGQVVGSFGFDGEQIEDLNGDQIVDELDAAMVLEHWGPCCICDIDGDGEVGAYDLACVLSMYGQTGDCQEDVNGDGVVDEFDLESVLADWGAC